MRTIIINSFVAILLALAAIGLLQTIARAIQ